MESVVEQLLETLKYLSDAELKKFQDILAPLSFHERYGSLLSFRAAAERNPLIMLGTTDMKTIVLCMMQAYSQQTVEKTKEVLNEMERTDLVQRLSDSSFRPKRKTIKTRHVKIMKMVLSICIISLEVMVFFSLYFELQGLWCKEKKQNTFYD